MAAPQQSANAGELSGVATWILRGDARRPCLRGQGAKPAGQCEEEVARKLWLGADAPLSPCTCAPLIEIEPSVEVALTTALLCGARAPNDPQPALDREDRPSHKHDCDYASGNYHDCKNSVFVHARSQNRSRRWP